MCTLTTLFGKATEEHTDVRLLTAGYQLIVYCNQSSAQLPRHVLPPQRQVLVVNGSDLEQSCDVRTDFEASTAATSQSETEVLVSGPVTELHLCKMHHHATSLFSWCKHVFFGVLYRQPLFV